MSVHAGARPQVPYLIARGKVIWSLDGVLVSQ
jgi:hypothetical protein